MVFWSLGLGFGFRVGFSLVDVWVLGRGRVGSRKWGV